MCIMHMGRIISAVPPNFLPYRHGGCVLQSPTIQTDISNSVTCRNVPDYLTMRLFTRTALVGISENYLNRRKLTADGSLSLSENNLLLTPSQLLTIYLTSF